MVKKRGRVLYSVVVSSAFGIALVVDKTTDFVAIYYTLLPSPRGFNEHFYNSNRSNRTGEDCERLRQKLR